MSDGTRRGRFIEFAEATKQEQRERLDRQVRARQRVERLKTVWLERPELKVALQLISMAFALMWIRFLLENGEQDW